MPVSPVLPRYSQTRQIDNRCDKQTMGAKLAIKIETPQFVQSQWEYEAPEAPGNPEFGMFRTLCNRKTGEMVDEFDMSWINEQEYSYYLKSFNWRYNQPNVVNTRFIVQGNNSEFCSQTYVARVYIEHVIVRLSEINDIPFPENLYVLMEALEGYAKIFEHSKYFVIEESQICVDATGSVKIWVNADLSINYPNSDHYDDDKNIGEERMVEKLVHIIAENTDRESEPELSFLEYFEEKKGFRGKKFEEARVLVLSYARFNETHIPDKFEAVLSLGKEDELTLQDEQGNYRQSGLYRHQAEDAPEWDNRAYQSTVRHPEEAYPSAAHPVAVIPPAAYQYPMQPQFAPQYPMQPQFAPHYSMQPQFAPHYPMQPQFAPHYPMQPQFAPPYSPYPVPNAGYAHASNSYSHVNSSIFKGYPAPQQQIQYFPHYTRVQYPVKVVQPVQQVPVGNHQSHVQMPVLQPQPQSQNIAQPAWQEQPKNLAETEEPDRRTRTQEIKVQKKQSKSKFSDLDSPAEVRNNHLISLNGGDIRVTLYNDTDNFVPLHNRNEEYFGQDSDQEIMMDLPPNPVYPKQQDAGNRLKHHPKNYLQSAELSQVDDLVAKSLPIKAGYPASTNAPLLNAFGQSDRSAYSHIHSKEHVDSFGLSASGQAKLKESMQGKLKQSGIKAKQLGTKVSTIKVIRPVKYYYSLQEELEIDPDIAADMERYFAG